MNIEPSPLSEILIHFKTLYSDSTLLLFTGTSWNIDSGKKLQFYFLGLLSTPHWLNLQHRTSFYITVNGDIQGLFFFLHFGGGNCLGAPVYFSHSAFLALNWWYSPLSSLTCHTYTQSITSNYSVLGNLEIKWSEWGMCSRHGLLVIRVTSVLICTWASTHAFLRVLPVVTS